MSELVDFTNADGVATIRLQHGKVNALSVAVLNELAALAGAIRSREIEARAVIVTGGPKIFAAGADIGEFASDPSPESFAIAEPERVRQVGGAFLHALNAIAAIPVPTIASVSGFALGGGLELALACDLRLASTRAKFGLPEILLGIIPGGGGTQRLARLVGPGIAKELVFTGRQVSSEEALRIGLVNEVVEPEELEERTTALAAQLAAGPPNSMMAAKSAIDGGLETTLDDGLLLEQDHFVHAFGTEDATVGVKSFLASGPGHADFSGIV
ncbi:MAG: enoyl-CoA hydratase/isomerase family protein [Microthrixaceae bacterium]